jgi:hypothetical protein
MSARDAHAVDHHHNQLKLRKLRLQCNSSDRSDLLSRREDVVRSNVKHDKLCRSSAGKNASNRSNNHEVSRSRLSVVPVRLKPNAPRNQRDNNSSHEASV